MTYEQLTWLESALDIARPGYMAARGGIMTTAPRTGMESVPIMAKAGSGASPRMREVWVDWDRMEIMDPPGDGGTRRRA